MFRHVFLLLSFFACLQQHPLLGTLVEFDAIETSWHGGTTEELQESIDGADVGRHGWFVEPQSDQSQTIVFHSRQPIQAAALDITLCFLSGRPNSFFGEFSISVTSDPEPSLQGNWEKLIPL